MKTHGLAALVAASIVVAGLSGCASVVSGRYADVKLDSNPTNAHVVVRDHMGTTVAETQTPAVVSLKRNRKFFLPAKYTATFAAPGYEPATVPLKSTINPWVAGNIVLGGPIGLVVDTATGAGWRPKHEQIAKHLTPIVTAQGGSPGAERGSEYMAQGPTHLEVQPASGTY